MTGFCLSFISKRCLHLIIKSYKINKTQAIYISDIFITCQHSTQAIMEHEIGHDRLHCSRFCFAAG